MSNLGDGFGGVDTSSSWETEKVPDDGNGALSPFEFVKSINNKKRIAEEDVERFYDGFLVNRAMSQHSDAVAYAQCMNKYPSLPKVMQYDFLFATIRKANRFGKWAKEVNVDVQMIIDVYQVNKAKAIGILDRLTKEDIIDIEHYYRRGGRSK